MAITTPDAVPGEVIEAAWGDAVRADLTNLDTGKFDKTGGALSGLAAYVAGLTPSSPNHLADKEYVDAADALALPKSGGTMSGALVVEGSPNPTTKGVAIVNGRVWTTLGFAADAPNFRAWMAGAFAAGTRFMDFRYGGAADTLIGSIAVVNASSIAYNTTSDKRLKTLTRPVDPSEALDKLTAIEPVHFTWNNDPAVGEQVGFLAQDLHTVAPEVVTVGVGEPGDGEDFVPWQVDLSKLVPTLVAAIQALTHRIQVLEEATP